MMLTDTPPKVKRRKASTVSLGDLPTKYPGRVPGFQIRKPNDINPLRIMALIVSHLVFVLAGFLLGRIL